MSSFNSSSSSRQVVGKSSSFHATEITAQIGKMHIKGGGKATTGKHQTPIDGVTYEAMAEHNVSRGFSVSANLSALRSKDGKPTPESIMTVPLVGVNRKNHHAILDNTGRRVTADEGYNAQMLIPGFNSSRQTQAAAPVDGRVFRPEQFGEAADSFMHGLRGSAPTRVADNSRVEARVVPRVELAEYRVGEYAGVERKTLAKPVDSNPSSKQGSFHSRFSSEASRKVAQEESVERFFRSYERHDPVGDGIQHVLSESRYKKVGDTKPEPWIKNAFKAYNGNRSSEIMDWQAKNRKATPGLAKAFDSIDPELKRDGRDSEFMAEAKMYGRAARNIRDGAVHLIKNPDEIITGPFNLGADIFEAGLHYYAGTEYYLPARGRNDARIQGLIDLKNSDGLDQRELILTAGGSALLFGGIGNRSVSLPRDFRGLYASNKLPGNLNAWQNFKNAQTKSTGARELTVSQISRAEELAETLYKQIRSNPKDIKVIAENTGLNEFRIQRIKEHLFFKEHQLRYSVAKFDADPLIVESWKRLESGTFTNKDLHLLNHELFESKFEGIFKTDYLTSHNAANRAGYVSPVEGLNAEQISEIYSGFLHRFG